MAYSSEVRINTGMNLDGVKKDAKSIEKELVTLQKKLDAITSGTKEPASLKAMRKELKEIEKEAVAVEKANKKLFGEYEKAAEKLADLEAMGLSEAQLKRQIAEIDRLAEKLSPIDDALKEIRERAAEVTQKMDAVKLDPSLSQEAQDISTEMADLNAELAAISQDGAGRVKTSFGQIANAAQTAAKLTVTALKKVAVVIGTLARGAARTAKGILGITKNMLGFGRGTRNASKGIAGLTNRIGRLALAALVFNQIRKALRSLTTAMNNVLMTNQDFARSFNAIKVNMLTAFAPIWEVVQPAILTFMQLLARFTAVLARFMATLFGKTYQQAKDSAAAIYDQAKATDKLGASASKAGKQLASFDEINKQAEDSAGGGTGADVWDFNIEEPENSWLSWLDEFAAKLKNIFAEIDPEYWFDLGAKLAAWVTNALNSVPWDTVQTWARNFATNLAAFLNGFLGDTAMWQAIGRTIAQGLNTALIFLYTMLTELDFYKIASAIGEGINTFLDEYDWDLLAKTIKAGIVGAISTLNGLLDTIKWATIGTKFSTLLNDAFADKDLGTKLGATLAKGFNAAVAVLLNFVQTFNWKEHAATLAASINKFIEDTNWDDVGRLVGEFFKGALDYINTAIEETDWEAFGNAIGDFLAAVDWAGTFKKLFTLVGNLIKTEVSIWNGFSKSIADSIKEAFGLETDGIGSNIVDGFFRGMRSAFSFLNPIGVFIEFIDGIKALFEINSPSKLFERFGAFVMQGFFNGISSLVDAVVKMFQKLWTDIQNVWKVAPSWFDVNVIIPVRTAFDTATGKIRDFFNNLWEKIKYIWNTANSWFDKNVITPIRIAFDTFLKAVYDFFRNAWANIQSVWTAVKGWFDTNVINPTRIAFDTALKAIIDFFRNAWANIQNAWSGARKWFEDTVINPIKTAFDGILTAIKKVFTDAWAGAESAWRGAADWFGTNVTDKITGLFTDMKNAVSKIFDSLFGWVSDLLDAIGSIGSSASSANKAATSSPRSVSASNYSLEGLDVPMLARGGVVDSATLAVIGERGREAVVPLENNTGWIRSIAQEIAAEMMSAMSPLQQSQQSVPVILEVDGRTFGRAVVDLGSAEKSRMGVRIQPTGAFI